MGIFGRWEWRRGKEREECDCREQTVFPILVAWRSTVEVEVLRASSSDALRMTGFTFLRLLIGEISNRDIAFGCGDY